MDKHSLPKIAEPMSKRWKGGCNVEVVAVTAHGQPLKHRLVGYAIETDGDERLLHVQTDVNGFMQSEFRTRGSTVKLRLKRI